MMANLIGLQFGYWTVIDRESKGSHGKAPKFICQCKCGIIRHVSRSCLIEGRSKSCGCMYYSKSRRLNGNPDETAFYQLYNNYRSSAKRRGYNFELTEEEFRDLTGRSCFYCGKEPVQVIHNSTNIGKYTYNGLDRLNPQKGYTSTNSAPCCGRCNEMKMGEGSVEFMLRVKRIYENNRGFMDFLENRISAEVAV